MIDVLRIMEIKRLCGLSRHEAPGCPVVPPQPNAQLSTARLCALRLFANGRGRDRCRCARALVVSIYRRGSALNRSALSLLLNFLYRL